MREHRTARRTTRRPRCTPRSYPARRPGNRRGCVVPPFFPRTPPSSESWRRARSAVVPPEMPTRLAVGQAVLHHQTHGHCHNTVGVVALGQGQVRHVRVEVALALTAVMLRIRNDNIPGPLGNRIAQIVERPLQGSMPVATPLALRARAVGGISAAADDLGLRQVLNTCDSLGTIGSVFSRSRHGYPPWSARGRENTAKRSACQ